MAVPRLLAKAGALGDHIDSVWSKLRAGGSIIAEPTIANLTNSTATTAAAVLGRDSAAAAVAATANALPSEEGMGFFQTLSNVGSFFTYITTKWAIATFTIAILLNRTHFYASSRVPLSFDRIHVRLALYLVPLLLFVYRIHGILQAIHCQTNPDWSVVQYGVSGKQLDVDFAEDGGFLWRASSALLFWQDAVDSCKAVHMLPPTSDSPRPSGSLALLWPLFISLGFGQFIENLSCALQGRTPVQEVGMTIFEHSLAFAEAEAVVSRPPTANAARFFKPQNITTPDATILTLSRSTVTSFANVPPEVLLISLISSMGHLVSNFLAIAGFRNSFRLVTTAIWGAGYISTFAWSVMRFVNSSLDPGRSLAILRFPTVCMIGFIPHLVIIAGTLCCGVIYLLALAVTVLNPPPGHVGPLTWRQRLSTAYHNLHANIHLSAISPITISWNEDFYTAVLKVGLIVLTSAREAVFLNEVMRIDVHSLTWLEKKRLQEALARRRQAQHRLVPVPSSPNGNTLAAGLDTVDSQSDALSGYAREKKTMATGTSADMARRSFPREDGVGVQQRQGRWLLTYQFLRSLLLFLVLLQVKILVAVSRKLRLPLPHWINRIPGIGAKSRSSALDSPASNSGSAGALFAVDGKGWVHVDDAFDVEGFTRERLQRGGAYKEHNEELEEQVSDHLYAWWKDGRNWGEVDKSGDYVPSALNDDDDDDVTSVISFSTATDADEWSDVENEGQRTPTQESFQFSRESTPMQENTLDLARLSHLLDPKSKEDREEARLLARRLQSTSTLTRSQYRKAVERDESRLLATSHYPTGRLASAVPMTQEEEEQLLEELMLEKRNASTQSQSNSNGGSWGSGADGLGAEGPQCVVCQTSPRTVLVWPCGCLSLCDECRIALAAKNYTACVCCRTNVQAYSRLYVP